MNLKVTKLVIKIMLAGLLLAALIFAFLPEPIKVDMVSVERGDLLITLDGEGKTRIHDVYIVSAPVDGRVTRIASEPGDMVKAGSSIIANMYPANPQFLDKRSETQAKADVDGATAALALANARVKQVQAQLDFDIAEFNRTLELFQKKSVSQAGLERAELSLKTLRAELETAESNQKVVASQLEAAKIRLLQPEASELSNSNEATDCHICLRSPIDGRVLRILHKSESIVQVGTPLVEIGNPNDLEVNIEMLSTNAVRVKVGDQALIKRWGGDQDINARVRVIEPSGFTKISALGVEEQRVNVILSFTDPIEKWQNLGDAFRVEAAIIVDRADDVIKIPLSALFRQNELWSVFVVEDERAILRQVVAGRKNDRFVEIESGLNLNETIITHPRNDITDGTSVIDR